MAVTGREGPRANHRLAPSGVLVVVVLSNAAFSVGAPAAPWAYAVSSVFSAATFLIALRTAGVRPQVWPWVLPVVVALTGVGVGLAAAGLRPSAVSALFSCVLVAVSAGVVVRTLARRPVVDRQAVGGAVAVYLLAGTFFAFAYAAMAALGSGEFFVGHATASRSDFFYFSFITQATVGYGDLVTEWGIGRMFAVLEAVSGQLYLVTVVAVVVSNLGRPRTPHADVAPDDAPPSVPPPRPQPPQPPDVPA